MRFEIGDLVQGNDLNKPEVIRHYGIGIVTDVTRWESGMDFGEHGIMVLWAGQSIPQRQYTLYFERVPCK